MHSVLRVQGSPSSFSSCGVNPQLRVSAKAKTATSARTALRAFKPDSRVKPQPRRFVPQLAQNFAPGAAIVEHAGQGIGAGGASEPPHSVQNFPVGTLAAQEGQVTLPPACGPAWPAGAAGGGG